MPVLHTCVARNDQGPSALEHKYYHHLTPRISLVLGLPSVEPFFGGGGVSGQGALLTSVPYIENPTTPAHPSRHHHTTSNPTHPTPSHPAPPCPATPHPASPHPIPHAPRPTQRAPRTPHYALPTAPHNPGHCHLVTAPSAHHTTPHHTSHPMPRLASPRLASPHQTMRCTL